MTRSKSNPREMVEMMINNGVLSVFTLGIGDEVAHDAIMVRTRTSQRG